MSIETVFLASQFVSRITRMAAAEGILLRVGSDFRSYADALRRSGNGQDVGPPFDPDRHFLRDGNGFWIVGHDDTGQLVHTQAVRVLDLAGASLSQYLGERFRDFPPTGVDIDLAASRYGGGPAAREISGTVIYHGDFWLRSGGRGLGGNGLTTLLARLAIGLSMLRFDPDYVFAFMRESEATRGLTERMGYMHVEPDSLDWRFADGQGRIRGFMIWVDRKGMEYLLRIPLSPYSKKKPAVLRATGTDGT